SGDNLYSEGQLHNVLGVVMRSEDTGTLRWNGQPVSGFTPFGTTGYSWVRLTAAAGTTHSLVSTTGAAFGVTSYGLNDFGSYGHMGGTLVNSVGPAIQVESPADGSTLLAGQTVLVTGRATTSTPSAPIVQVTVDGRPVEALDAAGHFFTRVTVQP